MVPVHTPIVRAGCARRFVQKEVRTEAMFWLLEPSAPELPAIERKIQSADNDRCNS